MITYRIYRFTVSQKSNGKLGSDVFLRNELEPLGKRQHFLRKFCYINGRIQRLHIMIPELGIMSHSPPEVKDREGMLGSSGEETSIGVRLLTPRQERRVILSETYNSEGPT